jgi:hypothetical protein
MKKMSLSSILEEVLSNEISEQELLSHPPAI